MGTFFKQVENSISTMRENSTPKSLSDAEIIYTLGDRTDFNNKASNYFSSFHLPYTYENMGSGTTMAKVSPEKYQLNTDKAVFIQISKNNYSDLVDGRSITLNVPQIGGSVLEVVSAFFSETDNVKKTSNDLYFGENVAFLFCDDINLPYTGTTDNTSIDRSTVSSWNPTLFFRDRPSAVSYNDLYPDDKDSDKRPWSGINHAVSVQETWPEHLDHGYNYDIPVGIAYLDKGYFVITHPDIVNNIPWTSGSKVSIGGYGDSNAGNATIIGANAGSSSGTTNIVFTGQSSSLTYEEISTNYSTSIVCIAMPQEFFISTNPSWDRARNLSEIDNETYNLDSIYVTQIGLYNIEGDLIAVAKMDRPIEKTYSNILTFNLNIEV